MTRNSSAVARAGSSASDSPSPARRARSILDLLGTGARSRSLDRRQFVHGRGPGPARATSGAGAARFGTARTALPSLAVLPGRGTSIPPRLKLLPSRRGSLFDDAAHRLFPHALPPNSPSN